MTWIRFSALTGRQGDQAGRVAADDHHACLGGEGQPVPAAPAQRAGDRPVGDAAGAVDAGEPVHHVPAKGRRAAQCGRDRERQHPGSGRRTGGPAAAAGEGMTGAISVPVTAASRGGRRDRSARWGGRRRQPGRPRVQAVL